MKLVLCATLLRNGSFVHLNVAIMALPACGIYTVFSLPSVKSHDHGWRTVPTCTMLFIGQPAL